MTDTVSSLASRMDLADQKNRSDLANHEDICAERYRGILENQAEVKGALLAINTRLGSISDAQIASAAVAAAAITNARPKWFHQVLFGAVLALFGWMASTIWSMETAKIDALQNRPPATAVTVNPGNAPVANIPAPIPIAPPAPADPE